MTDEIPAVVLDAWERQTTDPAELIEIAKIRAEQDAHVEWHIEYAEPGTSEWVKHARATGEEAARVAFNELRDADPAHQWRVVRIRVSETVEEW